MLLATPQPRTSLPCAKNIQPQLLLKRLYVIKIQRFPQVVHCSQRENEQATNKSHSVTSSGDKTPFPKSETNENVSQTDKSDRQLFAAWNEVKQLLKRTADPEVAHVIDSLQLDDLIGPDPMKFFRDLADSQLGPIMASMGIHKEPLGFFWDVVKLAAFLQFVSCGMLFYGSELWGDMDAGPALVVALGLATGFVTRPLFRMEQLLAPVYNSLLKLFLPEATWAVQSCPASEMQATMNRIGLSLAVVYLIPQALWHWDASTSTSFAVPMMLGWAVCDLTLLAAVAMQTYDEGEGE